MVTIKDVAKKAGVSPSTVSRAISGNIPVNKETRDKVMEAVKALKYEPNALAKGLKEGKTYTVGLIIPNISNPLFPALAKGVEDEARKNGYTVILCNTEDNLEIEQAYLDKLKKRFVDGFIFATAVDENKNIIKIKEEGIPVVLLVRHMEEKVSAVILDNFKGAYDAVTYLANSGHKKIAIINGKQKMTLYRERFHGYMKALADANIPIDDSLILDDTMGRGNGYEVMLNLLRSGNIPDAVFATSDPRALRAIRAIRAIKDCGYSIPDDISVMGFDDLEYSALFDPPLTTVSQPLYSMGTLAMKKLLNVIDSKGEDQVLINKIKPELVIRNSTK